MDPRAFCTCSAFGVLVLWLSLVGFASADSPKDLAQTYVAAVQTLNETHAKKPGAESEASLSSKMPRAAISALDALLKSTAKGNVAALLQVGEAALDLDRIDDFEKVRARLLDLSAEDAAKLGIALSRPRFVMRGLDGVKPAGLAAVADAVDEVMDAYHTVFGFAEWSKVPGKKVRFRVHLVSKITGPPHFAPEFPFHSEVDFPVVEAEKFTSPTAEGQFLLYGLAHELGHVIAMWGDANREEDFHAWAHYTGVVIVSWLAEHRKDSAALKELKDVRWQSVEKERARLQAAKASPGRGDRDSILALLFKTQDVVGTQAIGDAINALDRKDERLRIHAVRYYSFDALGKALAELPGAKSKVRELDALYATRGRRSSAQSRDDRVRGMTEPAWDSLRSGERVGDQRSDDRRARSRPARMFGTPAIEPSTERRGAIGGVEDREVTRAQEFVLIAGSQRSEPGRQRARGPFVVVVRQLVEPNTTRDRGAGDAAERADAAQRKPCVFSVATDEFCIGTHGPSRRARFVDHRIRTERRVEERDALGAQTAVEADVLALREGAAHRREDQPGARDEQHADDRACPLSLRARTDALDHAPRDDPEQEEDRPRRQQHRGPHARRAYDTGLTNFLRSTRLLDVKHERGAHEDAAQLSSRTS